MPIYIGDYLRDTAELSDAEHGAYLLLLMHYWLKGGEIGSDVDRLARVARTQPETARFILGYYFTLENGNYKNKRADIEMANADSRRTSARDNGLKGGRPSKNNPQETGGLTDGLPAANLAPNPQESSSPSPIPSQEEREEKEKSGFLPQLQSNPQKDGAARIEKARASWNSMAPGIGPACRLMAITFRPEDTSDCLRVMSVYTDEEILEAMVNYATLSKDPGADTPKYGSFVGFIRGGVEKFVASAEPEKAYKNHGKPEEESTADLLARIRAEEGLKQ